MQSRLSLDGFLPIHAHRAAPVQHAVHSTVLKGMAAAIGSPTVIAPDLREGTLVPVFAGATARSAAAAA